MSQRSSKAAKWIYGQTYQLEQANPVATLAIGLGATSGAGLTLRLANTVSAWRGEANAGDYADIPGFCRSVKLAEIAQHGHVLTPGRYVGGHKTLAGAANHVLGIKTGETRDGKKRFADTALAMSQAFTLCCTLDEAKAVREEVAFMQAVKVILTKKQASAQRRTDESRELAIRQIISQAVVSESVVDIFDAVGLDKPNIGLLDEAFLAQVQSLPEKNLAVELLERLLEGEIKSRFASNVVQSRKFSEMLTSVITRYQNRSIETAQVMSELVEMAKKFRDAASRGEELGMTQDEVKFYDALANNESAVMLLTDETLKKIAHELTENLRQNLSVDWSERESVRAKLRLMVKRILRKYKYPPDLQDGAVELVLQQVQVMGESWAV